MGTVFQKHSYFKYRRVFLIQKCNFKNKKYVKYFFGIWNTKNHFKLLIYLSNYRRNGKIIRNVLRILEIHLLIWAENYLKKTNLVYRV